MCKVCTIIYFFDTNQYYMPHLDLNKAYNIDFFFK
jgi:hypothetical protein